MSMFTPPGVGGRSRSRRSGIRRRVLVVVLALLTIVAASWAAWTVASQQSPRAQPAPTPSCPAPSPTPSVVAAGEVRVNVYNATDRRGLAARVAAELGRRGFRVKKVDNDPAGRTVTGAAEVRHSAAGAGAARTVAAQVGDVVSVPDEREDATVDLVLGAAFVRLQAPDMAAAALSPTPQARPAGC